MIDGLKIKALRLGRGWSQSEFAAACGVPETTLSKFESNRRPGCTLDTALKISTALGVTIDVLLEGGPPVDPPPTSAEAPDDVLRYTVSVIEGQAHISVTPPSADQLIQAVAHFARLSCRPVDGDWRGLAVSSRGRAAIRVG